MGFYNKKVVLVVYATLAALLLFTFQNCSANLFTAVTASPIKACEKENHSVDNLIRVSDNEIAVTKNYMDGVALPREQRIQNMQRAQKVSKVNNTKKVKNKKGTSKFAKSAAKKSSKKIALRNKKPTRESASDGDMRIRLKKIKSKKNTRFSTN